MVTDDKVYYLIKLLLRVAKEENVVVTPTKLQKVFFLLEKEKGVNLGLEFKPFIFGAYSKKLQDYIDKLIELGEVDVEEKEVKDPISGETIAYRRVYVLKGDLPAGMKDLPVEEIKEFFREWVKKSREEIMRYVYEKYPEYMRWEWEKYLRRD